MGLRNRLLKMAGKENFDIDGRIGNGYILRLCWRYGWMMIRGRLTALGHAGIANDVFIGRGVRLYEKRYLSIGAKTKIHERVKIDALSTDGVVIGDHCVLGRGTTIECTGGLEYLGKGVRMGNRTTFGSDCFFGAAGGIDIGDDVMAGQYVRFHAENHNYADLNATIRDQGVTHQGIRIGNNCWIGAGAVFLDGAALGDGCVVAANAVVTKTFPANSVIGGIPAKLIKVRGA